MENFDLNNNYHLRCIVVGHEKDVRGLSPLYTPEGGFVSVSRDITSRVWAPDENDLINFHEGMVLGGHENFISCVCVLPPDEEYINGLIVTGSNDKKILAYTLDSPIPVMKMLGHTNTVCALVAGKFGTLVSGSWDCTAKVWLKGKCVMTLEGHKASVWCLGLIPSSGHMLTGSADKTIGLWKAGQLERSFVGHSDCVRGLAVMSPNNFLSCSNDATIRLWEVAEGTCLRVFHGHTSFIYALACLPNGSDFVSCGEDKCLKIWKDGENVQTIAHPAQSVWSVCVLFNGDIVTGSSDGVIRVFSQSKERRADPEISKEYEQSVGESKLPSQIGDIKTEDLLGPEALLLPGKKEGQVLMIKRLDRIEAHQWNQQDANWVKIGDVVGGLPEGQEGSTDKNTYKGKQYDYVFSVDIDEGKAPCKLPYNNGEDPYIAAHQFLETNHLSQEFLDQVAQFIIKNASVVTLGEVPGPVMCDPFTGSSRYIGNGINKSDTLKQYSNPIKNDPFTGTDRYVPTSDKINTLSINSTNCFPEKNYIKFDQINVNAVIGKLKEFNSQSVEKMTDDEIDLISSFISNKISSSRIQEVCFLFQKFLQWPSDLLFPLLDSFRFGLLNSKFAEFFCSPPQNVMFSKFQLNLINKVSTNSDVEMLSSTSYTKEDTKNAFLIIRSLCNIFHHENLRNSFILELYPQLSSLLSCLLTNKNNCPADKQIQISVVSFFLNCSILASNQLKSDSIKNGLQTSGSMEINDVTPILGNISMVTGLSQILSHISEPEAFYRCSVGLGTLIVSNNQGELRDMAVSMAKSLDVGGVLKDIGSRLGKDNERIRIVCQDLLSLLS